MQQGHAQIKTYAAAFARAEKEYGVPPAVIAAFWGLESDFGANMGNLPTLRSLVSLAYDCRRSQMFQDETIAALKIIDRGDLTPVGDGRLMGRRTRPDAISADALFHLCGRLRRRRPPQPVAQPGRRDRLDRELHRHRAEMAARRALAAGSARAGAVNFPGTRPTSRSSCRARNGRSSASPMPTASRCRTTTCRPRCCCRWAAPARRSWPSRISPPTPNGTTR